MKKKIDWDKPKKGLLNSINAISQTITNAAKNRTGDNPEKGLLNSMNAIFQTIKCTYLDMKYVPEYVK